MQLSEKKKILASSLTGPLVALMKVKYVTYRLVSGEC